MKALPLTGGLVAWVDDADYERCARWKWTLDKNGYVVRKAGGRKNPRKVMLHRFIVNAPQGYDVDHADHDLLNNTRANLRVCTRSQNSMNRGPKPGSLSRFKGVSLDRRNNAWVARITVRGRRYELGRHQSEVAAALAYDQAAYHHFGEFAYLNFPERVGDPRGT